MTCLLLIPIQSFFPCSSTNEELSLFPEACPRRGLNITEDLVITNVTNYKDTDITLSGNLTIEAKGYLLLENTTLHLNCIDNKQFRIEVRDGGFLHLRGSMVDASNNGIYFQFLVYGSLLAESSTIRNVWGNMTVLNGQGGIEIQSGDATFRNSTILECGSNGVFSNHSTVEFDNCIVSYMPDDGIELNASTATVVGCNISHNGYGIVAFYSDLIALNNSFYKNRVVDEDGISLYSNNSCCEVKGNSFIETPRAVWMVNPINCFVLDNYFRNPIEYNYGTYTYYFNVIIAYGTAEVSGNTIYGGSYGIRFYFCEDGIAESNSITNTVFSAFSLLDSINRLCNNTMTDCAGAGINQRGGVCTMVNNTVSGYNSQRSEHYNDITSWRDAKARIINCSISSLDIHENSFGELINTPLKDSAIELDNGGAVQVKWYLDVQVLDTTGNPVANANIDIWSSLKNENLSFRTDGEGLAEGIELTEYLDDLKTSYLNEETKVYFTPHSIFAEDESLGGCWENITMDSNKAITMTLDTQVEYDNVIPVITSYSPNRDFEILLDEKQILNITVDDDNPHNLKYSWYDNDTLIQVEKKGFLIYHGSILGIHYLIVNITDGFHSIEFQWNVTVFEEQKINDSDLDGLPDEWENEYFSNFTYEADDDPDGDGADNLAEYENRTNPDDRKDFPDNLDPEMDGIPDWWEVDHFGWLGQSYDTDFDEDGYTDLEEYLNDWDPADPNMPMNNSVVPAQDDDINGNATRTDDDDEQKEEDSSVLIILIVISGCLLFIVIIAFALYLMILNNQSSREEEEEETDRISLIQTEAVILEDDNDISEMEHLQQGEKKKGKSKKKKPTGVPLGKPVEADDDP